MKEFENVQVGDVVLYSQWTYTRHDYYLTKVIKRTKTRITTTNGASQQEWSVDGNPYPRGHRRDGVLIPRTDENMKLYHRNLAVRRVERAAYELAERVREKDWDKRFEEIELRNLADVIRTKLKAFDPKEE